jgi:endoglucanase
MKGISVQTTTDVNGGQNVTGIDAGEWMDYTINVPATGSYWIEYRVASVSGGGKLELRKPTGLKLSVMEIEATGGAQQWVTISDTINLSAGKQTVRLQSVVGGWNINWLNFSEIHETSSSLKDDLGNKNKLLALPNPFQNQFKLRYQLAEFSPVEIGMYDLTGKLVRKENIEHISSLSGELNWDVNRNLPSGKYYILMRQSDKKVAAIKVLKTE